MINYYQILGLNFGASAEQVRKAYREYAKNFHPDKHHNSLFFKERFQELLTAYETLSSETLRNRYDSDVIANNSVATALHQELKAERQKVISFEQLLAKAKSQVEILRAENAVLLAASSQAANSRKKQERVSTHEAGNRLVFLYIATAIVVAGSIFLLAYNPTTASADTISVAAISPSGDNVGGANSLANSYVKSKALQAFPETFDSPEEMEEAPIDDYEDDTLLLATGPWYFQDAVISNTYDLGTGHRRARLRNLGRLRMQFDAAPGVQRITISAGAYELDGPSTWELWMSRDGGRTYARTGQPIETSGPAVVPHVFAGVANEPIRIEIRKTGGLDNRLNIDDIRLETATGPVSAVDRNLNNY